VSAPDQSKNWLEWLVFALGAVIVAGVVGCLCYLMAKGEGKPPEFIATIGRSFEQTDGYAVEVLITNRGDRTAEQVKVRVEQTSSAGEVTATEFDIAYVPPGATRKGMAIFPEQPRGEQSVTARVLGFQTP
jgi:uncharacterized protein (TIGR02588 family)